MKLFKYTAPALLALVMVGCKKDYLDTNPSNQVVNTVVFANTDGAQVALDGTLRLHYAYFGSHGAFGLKSSELMNDLMGNDMVVHTQGYGWFNAEYRYTAQQSIAAGGRPEREWTLYYRIINNANGILANIDAAAGPQEVKDDIKGQALALRANAYFYLINYFQHTYKGNENKPGVPIYTEPTKEGKPRGTVQDVYNQMVTDLTQAETMLTGKTKRHISNIDVHVAQGMLARVYLHMEDWAKAAEYANKARQGYSLMSASEYQAGFSTPNSEWMWGAEVITDQATIYASFFSHIDITTGGYAALGTQKKITKWLYDQIPDGDVRKTVFKAPGTGDSENPDYNQQKFRVPVAGSWAADYLFMRAAEMYLIEAEAKFRSGDEAGARAVLEELVKSRYPAYSAASLSGQALLNEILLQRRIELWGEGRAIWDIKRLKTGLNRPTGDGNHGLPNYDPLLYTMPDQDARFLLKIPQSEIDANDAIAPEDQNP